MGASFCFRCKLCGQPKQKHNCPYSQSLQRDIGVMVHSAVNAYTASEPGSLAPALLKMNNFVSYDSTNPSPEDGHPDTNAALTRQRNQHLHPPQCHTSTVTPQSTREDEMFHSPQSSLSTYSQEISPEGAKIIPKESNCGSKESLQHQGRTNNSRKRKHEQVSKAGRGKSIFRHPQAPLFAPSFQLRPEHYRAVTSKTDDCLTGYKYTPVPATFLERKRLSDTLFYLTREIPSMTSQCATVLREARANDDWDQGVAELMTQVVVGLYCGEGDIRLDGLQQYLLTLGVSC